MRELFGKLGNIFILLMIFYALLLGGLAVRYFIEYTVIITLEKTPIIILILSLTACAIYLAKGGIQLLGRWSAVVSSIVLVNLFFTLISSFSTVDYSNLLPIFNDGLPDLFHDITIFGAATFGETVLILAAVSGFFHKGTNPYKTCLLGVSLGGLALLAVMTRNLLLLGPDLFYTANFPSHISVRVISAGNFLERFESLISINMILLGLTKISLCIFAAAVGFSRLLGLKGPTDAVMPAGLLTLSICAVISSGFSQVLHFMETYRFLALVFEIAIPLMVWIAAEIKSKRRRKSSPKKELRGGCPPLG